jgi:starch synthase (maltosyl-transferring)
MMHTLAKIGFHQSYTYFAWRPTATEMGEYLAELAGPSSYYMRPSLWPTTHDILTPDMQAGGAPIFAARAVVAATGSPSWGIYSGYELVENVARPGAEEQIDNEKYEFKPREWARARRLGIAALLASLNETRAAHPALRRLRGLTVHATNNPAILCFSRYVSADESPTGEADAIIVTVSFDPHGEQASTVWFDPAAIGLPPGSAFTVDDALTGESYNWGESFYVKHGPKTAMAHLAAVRLP